MKIKNLLAVLFIVQLSIGMSSCDILTRKATDSSQTHSNSVTKAEGRITKLSSKEFSEAVIGKDVVLIDVRTLAEFKHGHLKNARLIDVTNSSFKDLITKEDMNKDIYIYCRSGARSGRAAKTMKGLGFKNVYDMTGGYMGWTRSGLPIVK